MKNLHILHVAHIEHIDKEGNVLWEEDNILNMLHDEGEQYILAQAFASNLSGFSRASTLYLGLTTNGAGGMLEDYGLAQVGEPSSAGYARIALSTTGTGVSGQDFVLSQPASFYKAASKTCTFTCTTPSWSAVNFVFLCTAASGTSGKLLCSVQLSQSRVVAAGDSLLVSINIGLSE